LASLEDGVGPAHRRSDGDCVESGEPNTNEFRAGIVVAASVLAGELHRANSDNAQAFGRHHSLFGPFVLNRQKAALRFAGTFFWQSPGLQILLQAVVSPAISQSPNTDRRIVPSKLMKVGGQFCFRMISSSDTVRIHESQGSFRLAAISAKLNGRIRSSDGCWHPHGNDGPQFSGLTEGQKGGETA